MSEYTIRRHHSAADFLAHAGPWLRRAEAENNLLLSLASRLSGRHRYEPPIYFAVVSRGEDVAGCVLRTPPFKLLVSKLPLDAADVVVNDVAEFYDAVPAVLGPDQIARKIARGLAQRQHGAVKVGMQQRIYRLQTLVPPRNPPRGAARPAERSDVKLVADWITSFAQDAGVTAYTRAAATAEDRIANGEIYLWIDDVPVSMAGWSGTTDNGVRIGYVYTPAALRGRGYASAITAAATQSALDAGYAFCCLFTDLSNPTSNSIYQKLGYEPVTDMVDYVIEAAC